MVQAVIAAEMVLPKFQSLNSLISMVFDWNVVRFNSR